MHLADVDVLVVGARLPCRPVACATGSTVGSRWYDSEFPNSKDLVDLMEQISTLQLHFPLTMLVCWLAG